MAGNAEPGFCSADELAELESSGSASTQKSEHTPGKIDADIATDDVEQDRPGDEFLRKQLFPYSTVRDIQTDLLKEVSHAVDRGNHLIVHAPTGLGKTAATLSPALRHAIDSDKKVFFLTSRHTQHLIAINTLREIKEKYSLDFTAVDMIGKKWMCPVPGVETLYSNEFTDYCKKQREENKCEFYTNTKKGNRLATHGQAALEKVQAESPCHVERIKAICEEFGVCTYEITAALARDAKVVVADYYHVFNPWVRDMFFNKLDLSLDRCIFIVDEGHNLPERIRNLLTTKLTNRMIKRGIKEAKKLEDEILTELLVRLQDVLNEVSNGMNDYEEKIVRKEFFVDEISAFHDYDDLVALLDSASQSVKKDAKQSSLSSIAAFLDAWKGSDEGYVRIISQRGGREPLTSLSYRCLDPSTVSGETISSTHSTILMSGTLTPTSMYKDILGFPDDAIEKEYGSPFPETNRLSLVVPETTTKFSLRSPEQFRRMAEILAQITDMVPGNSAVFFPSYHLRDQVYSSFSRLAEKTVLMEDSRMTKQDKMDFLEKFKSYQGSGAVLLGVVSGSFGEGMDFPGDLLKCVVVVGLPLQVPTLETRRLIDYYDHKFGKGWEYGYVAPAFTRCLQSAGRCIRSESDRGLVVFLDKRYRWPNYFGHFPADWDMKVSSDFSGLVSDFFNI